MSVDIKIGFVDSPRELALASTEEREALSARLNQALQQDSGVLELDDTSGRHYIVRTGRIAWVEVGEENPRQVGFIGR
ncbi:DUF3107 domain-containing protein [Corynebacterium uropygiale]|uniref:DUF3107 domain-containing protein n=1 Tax=Corynebacterium uropygiale TaxID=1775911 RepID=A0A9X1QS98_9CORY|nr:DUF3107 domain-containing protein [Corynebacterium uropygiale]MCF4006090.1 DUF3107 domain-containing protein [Corynebacterium uropygiale]